jgi:hypothetical protein
MQRLPSWRPANPHLLVLHRIFVSANAMVRVADSRDG